MRFHPVLLVVAACSLVPLVAFAEPPTGAYALSIGGADSLAARLRLLDGQLGPECDNGEPTEVCATSVMHTDAAGVVTGVETRTYTGTSNGDLRFVFNGTVKARPGLAKAKLLFTAEGTLVTSARPSVATGNGKAFCRDDIVGGLAFTCDSRAQLCFEDSFGSDCDRFFLTIDLAEQRSAWTLDLDVTTAANGAITGDARATLGNAVVIDFTVTGKYSSKTDLSNLSLKGLGAGIKSKIVIKRLEVATGDPIAGRVKFRVADQVGVYEITAPAP